MFTAVTRPPWHETRDQVLMLLPEQTSPCQVAAPPHASCAGQKPAYWAGPEPASSVHERVSPQIRYLWLMQIVSRQSKPSTSVAGINLRMVSNKS